MMYVKTLREILSKLPDDGEISIYEGEESGIAVSAGDKGYWINTGYSDDEESQDDDIIELLGKGWG